RSNIFRLVLSFVIVLGGLAVARARESRRSINSHAEMLDQVPRLGFPDRGYVSSQTCKACHPGEFGTWHASFHRTMTQVATPQAVIGNFDNQTLHNRDRTYRLSREDEGFWVEMVDPDWEAGLLKSGVYPNAAPSPPRVKKRVVMTTGSHHQQG